MVLNKGTQIVKGFPETYAEDIDDYLQWVSMVSSKGGKVVFRGQRKYWPLLPSISRDDIKPDSFIHVEKKLFETFKDKASPCLHLKPQSDWDWLVVGQHHGLPTRVLDWSIDPLVALFFATEKSDLEDSQPEVWALRVSKEDIIENLDESRPFYGTRSKLFETNFMIPRIEQQKGCFILFKHIDKKDIGFIPLEKNSYLRGKIEKIRFFQRLVPPLKKQLEIRSYIRSRLFPDIDEIARVVKDEIFNKYIS